MGLFFCGSLWKCCWKQRGGNSFFQKKIDNGEKELPITDFGMTRFWISLEQGVELVIKALEEACGGESYISKIPSFRII